MNAQREHCQGNNETRITFSSCPSSGFHLNSFVVTAPPPK